MFERFAPTEPGHSVSYQNDMLYRCPACGTVWLSQFWEIDTPETQYEEWGITSKVRTPLASEDLVVIEDAISSGDRLAHDTFYRGTGK